MFPTFGASFDIDGLIRYLFEKGPMEHDFPASILHEIFRKAERSLSAQPSLLNLGGPINVCGDLHGQYADLLHIFQTCGWPYDTRYLFLGDYVDRGKNSLEVLVLLLSLQIRFPQNVHLLRGNHEIRYVNKTYGFLSELRVRYSENNEWEALFDATSKVFGQLPVSAMLCGTILCLHGGLSPSLKSIEDLSGLKRGEEDPSGLLEDLLWADPSTKCKGFEKNENRGCSFTFGDEAISQQCKQLGVTMIVRGHQVPDNGVEFSNNHKVLTIFSAAGYSDDFFNKGAVMHVTRDKQISFTYLEQQELTQRCSRFANAALSE